jgi:hypothetical protein
VQFRTLPRKGFPDQGTVLLFLGNQPSHLPSRCDGTVAPFGFRLVQGVVSYLQKLLRRSVSVPCCRPQADGHVDYLTGDVGGLKRNATAQSVGQGQREIGIAMRQNDQKLLASVPADYVVGPHRRLQALRDMA